MKSNIKIIHVGRMSFTYCGISSSMRTPVNDEQCCLSQNFSCINERVVDLIIIDFLSPTIAPEIIDEGLYVSYKDVCTVKVSCQKHSCVISPINCAARTVPSTPAGMPSLFVGVPLEIEDANVNDRHAIERAIVNTANPNGTELG